MKPIYLDYNATTPLERAVADSMTPYLYEHFGNPSSGHIFGAATRRAVEDSRMSVAQLLHCEPSEVIFTSGGTESDNWAIKGAALAARSRGTHLIASSVEHPAVLEACRFLMTQGFRLTLLPVDSSGRVHPETLEKAISPDTILVSVMHANNEVGTIQPIRELADIAHRAGALFHTDAAQSVGKVPVKVNELGVDLLTVAGHKLYAPKGVGVLYVKSGTVLERHMHGAGHEGGRRAGTENVILIAGLGKACQLVDEHLERYEAHMLAMRDRLWQGLSQRFDESRLKLNGHPDLRLPNTLSVSFRGIEANTLLSELSEQVAASAGAACHTGEVSVSPVLEAMRVPVEWAMGTIRFSVGRETSTEEIDRAIELIGDAVSRLTAGAAEAMSLWNVSEDMRLTQFTHGLGCACKLGPKYLEQVLSVMPKPTDPNVMVGSETNDDAAVYRLDDRLALVQTLDFFTPVVDDPYTFGAIAAANALSDIYAMGAKPLFALNIVGFPASRLPVQVLLSILKGASEKAREAGIFILGGHTVDDLEPRFGLSVTGIVAPGQETRNNTARPSDALVLTKPLGTGILTTAAKRGVVDRDALNRAIGVMMELNRAAATAMRAVGVNACTDVTGFGLLGHLMEMCRGSRVNASVSVGSVPLLEGAGRLAASDVVPGGTKNNLAYVTPFLDVAPGISPVMRLLLSDAQTSGGLLMSVPAERLGAMLIALREAGVVGAAHIGYVTGPGDGRIRLTL